MQGSSIFPEEAIRRVYNSKLDVLEDYLIGLSLNNENLLRIAYPLSLLTLTAD
jgi:hypothetical protein